MSTIQFSIVSSGEDAFVTAFVPGEPTPLVAAKSGHPNFEAIVGALASGEADRDEIVSLFDVAKAVEEKFSAISDRVLVSGGHVLFDGVEIDNSLTKQIVRFLDDGVDDWEGLVNFFENVMDNPEPHSREQLYDWLSQRDFSITPEGFIVAYKGVTSDDEHGYRSISSGREPVYVEKNGEVTKYTGRIPNPVGSVISMDRNLVQHDPSVGCHVGLHVGTYEYARSFSRGAVLEVHVNPRDVRSVPTDCSWAKVRVCRYEVVDAIDQPYSTGLVDPDGYRDDDEAVTNDDRWDDFDL